MIIQETNPEKAKLQIKKAKPPIIVKAQSDEFNRKLLEYGKFDVLIDLHSSKGKDKLKSLDSGLNHVFARIASKNGVAIGIDLDGLRKLDKKEKAIQLARIAQNIKICRKAKCQIQIINAKDKKNVQALLQSLGASSQQTSNQIT